MISANSKGADRMNRIKELADRMGISQKELAISIGVSQPTVSDWCNGKKNPTGKNLDKVAAYFNVTKAVILGYEEGIPEIPPSILKELSELPKTPEAKILSLAVDKLPKAQREMAVNVVRAMFSPQYADLFTKEESDDT